MGPVEVITYGGGEFYRDTFQAVALMSGTSGLSSLIHLAMIIGLIMGIVGAIFNFDIGKILKWFLMANIILGIMFVPKVQIHVTDLFNPSLTGADVANVPLGLALPVSISSRVGNRAIELTETAFGDPEATQFSNTGMIYGAKVFERLRTAQIADPRFDQNMQSFVQGCIYYDILENHYSVGELVRQNDIWNYVTVTKGTNPGRAIEYYNPASVEVVSCTVAAQRLNAEWATTLQSSISLFEKRLRPEVDDSMLQAAFQAEMGALHPYMLGASRDATSTFQQVLMANAVRRGVSGFAAEAGSDPMSIMAETQAEVQTRNTQKLLGGVAEKAIVVLKIVVDLLFIGMFPILFAAFLLPGFGPTMLKGYLTGFLYLQLWGPMYVIVHKISMGTAAVRTEAAAFIPGTDAGIKIANLDALGSVNADISAVAGVMTMMIPVLAAMLTKGAMAVGHQGEALMGQFRSGAEAAGAAQTTGNYSFGNTAFENHSWNNLSANRQVTSGMSDMGRSTVVDPYGNTTTESQNGGRVYETAKSSTGYNVRWSNSVSSAETEAAGIRREESKALSKSLSEGQARIQAEGVERINSWMNGTTSTSTSGNESRSGWGSTYQVLDQATQNLVNSTGMSQSEARQTVGKVAAEAFGTGQVGLEALGNGGGIGARLSGGLERSKTENATDTNQMQAARTVLTSMGYTDRLDRTTAQYASESFSSTSSAQNMSQQKISDTFSSTRSITEAATQAESAARTHEQRADYATTNSASIDRDMNTKFADFAMNRLVGQTTPTGVQIDQAMALEMLSGRGGRETTEMMQLLENDFRAQQMQIAMPGLVTQNRDVGQTVQQMPDEQLRVLEGAGDGSSLRQDVSLGSLAQPGSGISDHAPGTQAFHEERQEARSAREEAARPQSRGEGGGGGSHNEPQRGEVFDGPYRQSIRQQTMNAGEWIDSNPMQAASGQHGQQVAGLARLSRRHPE